MDLVVVTLPAEAYASDDAAARHDVGRARRAGWNGVGWQPPGGVAERRAYNIAAYRSERAFAHYMQCPEWEREKNGFRRPDVAGFSVRLATGPRHGLVIHDRDCVAPYMLMRSTLDPLSFQVVGAIRNREAVALRRRGVGRSLPGTTHAWVIPAGYLRMVYPPNSLEAAMRRDGFEPIPDPI